MLLIRESKMRIQLYFLKTNKNDTEDRQMKLKDTLDVQYRTAKNRMAQKLLWVSI